jgi:hypothetical protein
MDSEKDAISNQVLELMRAVARQNKPLTMSNVFKGVTISQESKVLGVEEDYVIFQPPYSQIMAIALAHQTFLHSPEIPGALFAHLKKIDLISGKLLLSNFEPSHSLWKRRTNVRVAPKENLRAVLRIKDTTFSVSVADLSTCGMGLLAYKLFDRGLKIGSGTPIVVDYVQPSNGLKMILRGTIAYVSRIKDTAMSRLGVHFHLNMDQERKLMKYVRQRENEILGELETTFRQEFEPRSAKDLYF